MHPKGVTLAFGFIIGALLAAPAGSDAQAGRAPRKGYVPTSGGVNYYYEIHGQGEPLLLLHGGLGSMDMFGPLLPALSKQRQVIAVDLHGHGRTTLGERPIKLTDIGNDLATVLRKLDYDTVDIVGYFIRGRGGAPPCGAASRARSPARDRLRPIRAGRLLS